MSQPIIVWFRQDLRIDDNPALNFAIESNQPVIPLFIISDDARPLGAMSLWWRDASVKSLAQKLAEIGAQLLVAKGKPLDILNSLIKQTQASTVCWNRIYEPELVARDKTIKQELKDQAIRVESFNASLLFEPWEIQNKSGTPFKVFTPFWRHCMGRAQETPLSPPINPPKHINSYQGDIENTALIHIDQALNAPLPDHAHQTSSLFFPGEGGAWAKLNQFTASALEQYADGRDFPALDATSRLSPHLRWGEISPRRIWAHLHQSAEQGKIRADNLNKFLSELGWREFSTHLMFINPNMHEENLQKQFDAFAWEKNDTLLERWKHGETGYPMVDAGMRELLTTGFMHNRVRMITASFLIKHLLIDWREGEKWFWERLVDADMANNPAGWQWVAGCGADAAPFFRIFNPIIQGQKFDPDGVYIRHHLPALKALNGKSLYSPWTAKPEILNHAHIELGTDYPAPIVQHEQARERALAAFKNLRA